MSLPIRTRRAMESSVGQKCFVGPVSGTQTMECHYRPGPTYLQCCCDTSSVKGAASNRKGPQNGLNGAKYHGDGIICMPSFIVIGSQKSGSTALFAHFLIHPMFKPPSRKETHYFDNTKILSDPKSKKSHGRPASQYALSYPRWSDSIDTSKLMTGEATPSYILRLDAPKMMAATLPHARLLLIIRNPVDRAYSEYQMKYRRVVRLFDPHDSRDIVPLLGDIAPCYSLEWEDVENPEMQRRDLENPGMQRRRRHVVSDPPPAHKRPVEAPFQLCLKSKLESRFRLTRMLKRKKGGLLGVANCMTPPNLHTARIQLANCLDGVQRETLDPLASILRGEMNFVQTMCTSKQDNKFMWGSKNCWPEGSKANIKSDFIIRGLYVEQIRQYLRYYHKSQLLILSDKELKADPVGVMRDVFEFVGLPDPGKALDGLNDPKNVAALIEKQWPDFESDTGWKFQSSYTPLEQELRDELGQFYAPHNTQLKALLEEVYPERDWNSLIGHYTFS